MDLKKELLGLIKSNPMTVRKVLTNSKVQGALGSIGILPKVLELHSPSAQSHLTNGVGPTLCGIRGTRHHIVTCKRCLRKIQDCS